LLLIGAAGCGGISPDADPLASIADSVPEEERAPARLAEAWRRVPPAPLTLAPAVGESGVYLAAGNQLLAWRTVDGEDLWRLPFDSSISAAPLAAPAGPIVVATHGGDGVPPRLWWVSTTGDLIGQRPMPQAVLELAAAPRGPSEQAAPAADVIYRDDGGVGRVGPGEGSAEWYEEVAGLQTIVAAGATDLVLVNTSEGRLLAFAASDGAAQWEYTAQGSGLTRPAVTAERIYVGDDGGRIVALDAGDRAEIWHRNLGVAVIGAPAVTGDLLWVAALDGRLHGYDAGNGTVLHDFALSSRNYLDLTDFGPWLIVGARRGPWLAVRAPTRAERSGGLVRVQVPRNANEPAIELPAAAGPAGVAVVNGPSPTSALVFLQPQLPRSR
jgi:outer membrane protein assembly factor BamB